MEPQRYSCKVRAPRIRLCAHPDQQIWEQWIDCRCPVRRDPATANSDCGVSAVKVWMSHGDQLSAPPPDFHIIGHTESAPYAAIAHNTKPIYGIQFHPEVTHSPRGKEVIAGFVHNICGCKNDWTMVRTPIWWPRIGDMCAHSHRRCQEEFVGKEVARIREICGNTGRVIGAVSGGVDSTVAAKLMHEAIGDRCVFPVLPGWSKASILFPQRSPQLGSTPSWSITAYSVGTKRRK